jgi:hypothetical protein
MSDQSSGNLGVPTLAPLPFGAVPWFDVTAQPFGARGNGIADDTAAITAAITAANVRGGVVFFPAGSYYCRLGTLSGLADVSFVGVPGRTTLTGGSRTVANASNPALSGSVSANIMALDTCENIRWADITFDGGQAVGPTYYAANYVDNAALVEARSCSDLRMDRCTIINFTPAIGNTPSGGVTNPDAIEWMNQGPMYFKACATVQLFDLQLLTPCYGEGVCVINSTNTTVERMRSTSGYLSSPTYGTSSALHVVGPLSKFTTIRDCHWYRTNGSALECGGGLGMITVEHNTVDGGGGFNMALANVGKFDDFDLTAVGVRIIGNRFSNMIQSTSARIPGVYLGSRVDGGFQYQDVQIHDNVFDSVYACISVRGCKDVSISGNRGSRCYVSNAPTTAEGLGVSVIGCSGLSIKNNTMDFSEIAGGGGGANRATTGFLVYDSDDVDIAGNAAVDALTNNYRLGTQDRYTIPFTNGGTALRDMLWNQVWLGTAYTITGATSGATMSVQGRVKTSGDWDLGTAAGVIYGFSKVGTFTPGGEDVTLNGVAAAAHTTADASFASWMNRMTFHDNHSRTITTTTAPYFCQPVGSNAMVGQYMRSNNMHNGAYIDPLNVSLNAGDANVVLTENSLRTVQFLSTLTADRTVTIPASTVQNGEWFIVERGVTSAFSITIQTSTPTTVFIMPPYVKGYALIQYNQGWRCVMFAPADQPASVMHSAVPTAGTWLKGQIVQSTSVAAGSPWGWVCTVAGTPGTWVALYVPSATQLVRSDVTLTDQAGAGAGSLTNAPTAGNPSKWIAINDNGTTRKIPTWL